MYKPLHPSNSNNRDPLTPRVRTQSSGAVDNVKVTDQSVQVKLPALKTQSGVGTYCYLQEMPTTLDVGMTGLQFYADDSIDFISVKGVRPETTTAAKGQWNTCSDFGRDDSTVPLYEVVGVDLADSDGATVQWVQLDFSSRENSVLVSRNGTLAC